MKSDWSVVTGLKKRPNIVQLGGTVTNTRQLIGKKGGVVGTVMLKSPFALVVALPMDVKPLLQESETLAPDKAGLKIKGEGFEQVRPSPMTCNGGWQFETEAVAMKKKAIRSAELILSFLIVIREGICFRKLINYV